MPAAKPLVYLILGAAGSGRRELLADLLDGGLAEGDQAAVLLAEGETPDPADSRLGPVIRWTLSDGTIAATPPPDATRIFFVTDGRRNPLDQIEAFKPWMEAHGGELARVLCVVNCQLAEKNPPLLAWFDACVHFADVVLLNRREGVENKWLSDFQTHFKGQFFPCLFELVKHGHVANPALLLEPQARRMSHLFDEEPDWIFTKADGQVLEDEEDAEDDEEVEVTAAADPWLARDATGRRVKKIPEIGKFIG
ncbi:MAG: hypothetical protein WCL04_08035 [Verrucomicrobiota bacterium]